MIEGYKHIIASILFGLSFYRNNNKKKYSLRDLSKMTNISVSELSKILNDKRKQVGYETRDKLARFLGITIVELERIAMRVYEDEGELILPNDWDFDSTYTVFHTPFFRKRVKYYEKNILDINKDELYKTSNDFSVKIKEFFLNNGYEEIDNPTHLECFFTFVKNNRVALIPDINLEPQSSKLRESDEYDFTLQDYRKRLVENNDYLNFVAQAYLYPEVSEIFFVEHCMFRYVAKYLLFKTRKYDNLNIYVLTYDEIEGKDKHIPYINGCIKLINHFTNYDYDDLSYYDSKIPDWELYEIFHHYEDENIMEILHYFSDYIEIVYGYDESRIDDEYIYYQLINKLNNDSINRLTREKRVKIQKPMKYDYSDFDENDEDLPF